LTKPSKILTRKTNSNVIYIDKYGRETKEANAQELIIYNE
jgi:hypothetical protein